jgi:hypothetical protein
MGTYIPPLSYWAIPVLWSPMNPAWLNTIPPNIAFNVPVGTYYPNELNNLSFTNLSVQTSPDGAIGLSGTLYNNNPIGTPPSPFPAPAQIFIQVFVNTGSGYSLVADSWLQTGGNCYGMDRNSDDNIPSIPSPQTNANFVLQLSTNVSVTNGSLTNGIITIEETY